MHALAQARAHNRGGANEVTGATSWWPARPADSDSFETPPRTIECPNCGLIQTGSDCMRRERTFCCRCESPLVRRVGKNFDAALACTIALLLLLIPAIAEPFLTTSVFGDTRTSVLPMSAQFLWREGWPLLALAIALVLLVCPVIRFATLAAVLLAIRMGKRPRWLGPTFRVSNALQTWAMLDVFLLGLAVAYARLRTSIEVTIDTGAICFVVVALLSLFVRAALDKARVWQLISPDPATPPAGVLVACPSCGLLLAAHHEGHACPRCSARVTSRRPDSIPRASALLIAAMLLYIPANLYPIATIPIELTPTAYTVIGGVVDLSRAHLLGLALLVFCASFAVPLLKMVGLSWCVLSTLRRSKKRLVAKTRVYRLVEEIGRWSMVDPLTIACFVPVLHFNGLIDGRAEPAATPFAAVAILTTIAVKCFDPRSMWDAAQEPP